MTLVNHEFTGLLILFALSIAGTVFEHVFTASPE